MWLNTVLQCSARLLLPHIHGNCSIVGTFSSKPTLGRSSTPTPPCSLPYPTHAPSSGLLFPKTTYLPSEDVSLSFVDFKDAPDFLDCTIGEADAAFLDSQEEQTNSGRLPHMKTWTKTTATTTTASPPMRQA